MIFQIENITISNFHIGYTPSLEPDSHIIALELQNYTR